MDTVTYPESSVISFISDHMIPLRVRYDAQPTAGDFNVKWTPTIVTLDYDGKEHHRTVGFLKADEFMASMLLGIAKIDFDHDQFNGALENLKNLLSDFPSTRSAPEGIYLQGVTLYKQSNDAGFLKKAYEQLTDEFPNDEWTQRAYPYRLL
ncbi:MAG: hypothetical protein PHP23_10900 [Desulfobacterales bacterium]|nr:hypothetical protein [Desulfobacterales bacterium]MDD4071767.1 hypothetical protein [Desulfobacterales bacterium]MDD4391977.1 hypothetical protein [Desulfobacterales bacterium]